MISLHCIALLRAQVFQQCNCNSINQQLLLSLKVFTFKKKIDKDDISSNHTRLTSASFFLLVLGTRCFTLCLFLIFNIFFPGAFLFMLSDNVMILRLYLNKADATGVQDIEVNFAHVEPEMPLTGG